MSLASDKMGIVLWYRSLLAKPKSFGYVMYMIVGRENMLAGRGG